MEEAGKKSQGSLGKRRGNYRSVTVAVEEIARIAALLVADHPDLKDDAKAFADTLDGLTDAREIADALLDSAVDITRKFARIEADNETLNKIIEGNVARQKRLNARKEAMQEAALQLIRAITPPGQNAYLEGDRYTAWEVKPGQASRKLIEVDASQTPEDLMEPQPDKPKTKDIKAKLVKGEEVPGWELGNTPPSRLQMSTR